MPAGMQQSAPLTEAQSGLWYVQRIDPESPALNTGQYIELHGGLDVAAFTRAVNLMVAETDALALTFSDGPDGPVQRVDETLRPWLETVDLSTEPDPAAAALGAMQQDSDTPLDLGRDRLAAFRLYILGPQHYFWYERIHHLAIDGYGMVLVTNRVGDLYSALTGQDTAGNPPPGLEQVWAEDAEWRTSPAREKARAFWHENLERLPETTSLASGKPVASHHFLRETHTVPQALLDRMNGLANRTGLMWPDVLTGIAAAYCRRFAASEEITVGLPFMGRMGSKAARIPCMLMNVLPLRVRNGDTLPLADYLSGFAKDQMKARRHGRYRSELLRRELGLIGGQRRLYGPLINVQPFDMPPRFAGLEARLHILGAGAVDDITFTFRGDAKELLTFEVDANPALYSQADTGSHARRFLAFLDAALDAEKLADVPLASPEDMARIDAINATAHPVPETTLAVLVENVLMAQPGAPVLRFDGRTMTRAELDARSSALAATLQQRGAGPESLVAVALPRSFELVIALVAIIRAGAAWLPLDTGHPRERLERILSMAQPVCLLTDEENASLFTGCETPALLKEGWPQTGRHAAGRATPDNLAYVIYTSGSTGEPKGVAIEHRAIVNRLEWMRTHYAIGPDDRILQKTPATFDVSVWEFFLPLTSGAVLVIAPPDAHRDPAAIAAIMRAEAITVLHFVPSMLSAFLASPAAHGLAPHCVFCSGEELTAAQRQRFHSILKGGLHNLYGPTEAAVDVSYWPAGREDRSMPVPIGYPVWNTQLHVLDDNMQALPAGVAGNLYLGGVQLARGYLGRPDLTAERFVVTTAGQRLYHTGDMARREANGAVTFLGRSDHQVKIRGLRIELGEIEAALMATGLLREVAVIARDDNHSGTGSDRRIVAYVVGRNDAPETESLRAALATRLPDYMIPSAFVALPALPVTSNGKLDRKALPAPAFAADSGQQAQSPTERVLARLFARLLGLPEPASRQADFFTLGGDSLLAVHLTLAIQEECGFDPGLGVVFENPQLAALASAIDSANGEADHGLGPVIRLRNDGHEKTAPLFIIHPAGGICWGYRHLANALGTPRDIYGLQADVLDAAATRPESLDVLARIYAARIADIRPHGLVHIAGWSVGGIIAQAVAAILEEQGRECGLVALLDAYPCECWRAEPEPTELKALQALLAIAGHDPADHPELVTREEIIGFLVDSGSPMGQLPPAALDGVVRAVLDTNRLVRNHYHSRYGGVLAHFRAALDHTGSDLSPALWHDHAGRIEVIDVPFLHSQLSSAPAAMVIGPLLADRLSSFDQQEQN